MGRALVCGMVVGALLAQWPAAAEAKKKCRGSGLARALCDLEHGTPEQRKKAAGTIVAAGARARKPLLKAIRGLNFEGDMYEDAVAPEVLAEFADVAVTVGLTDQFLAYLDDDHDEYVGMFMLRLMAPKIVDRVVERMGNADLGKREQGYDLAGAVGDAGAARVLPLLVAGISDKESRIRISSVDAIGNLGAAGAPAMADLVKVIHGSDTKLIVHAVTALGGLGAVAAPHARLLCRVVVNDGGRRFARDERGRAAVRGAAVTSLGSIGPGAIDDIVRAFNAIEDNSTRRALIKQLRRMGAKAAPAIPALVTWTRDDGKYIAWDAAEVLGDLGPVDPAVLPALLAMLDGDNTTNQQAAINALRAIGPPASAAIPRLEELAKNGAEWAIKDRAKRALEAIRAK